MFDVVLYEPEIPPNTGNVMRLCANVGARLHLIEPLGFSLAERRLRRAGLDYADLGSVRVHHDLGDCQRALPSARWFAVSTRGTQRYDLPQYRPGDAFLFGPETRGLPSDVLGRYAPEHVVRLPMAAASRSLNLANAVAVVVYEAWRQNGFGS